MKQTILIGLGGTGSRVVNNVVATLREKSIDINDGKVVCAVLDTNTRDTGIISESGTNVPVVPTSDERKISDYLMSYAGEDPLSWCPYTQTFGEETMLDGASEVRVKSRIAFMDLMHSDKVTKLTNEIDKVFLKRPDRKEKIRVLIVTSLSGGTGSGMFIQFALWIRQYLEAHNSDVSLRGILMLPDIFVSTITNISRNARKKMYVYANAYAAIREVNSIDKVIRRGYKPQRPIVINDLFDSRDPVKKPLFDNCFFIDNIDANGASFKTSEAYEHMVAQIIYMQLYAPMMDEMVSVEDNLYRTFEASSEPVYGSCGTCKAEYPVKTVAEYCALRAAKDSVSDGWNRIDQEITVLEKEILDEQKDGIFRKEPFSKSETFIRLFDEKSKKQGSEIGPADLLFVNLRGDVSEIERIRENDKTIERHHDKVQLFMERLNRRIDALVTEKGGCESISDLILDFPSDENENGKADLPKGFVNRLKEIGAAEKDTVELVLSNFNDIKETLCGEIFRAVVSYDMGSVNLRNEGSLAGLFLRKNPDGEDGYVHPVAAKYLLYKLAARIEKEQRELTPENLRSNIENGDANTTSFDNEKTKRVIETLTDYWKQVGIVSKEEAWHFIHCFRAYNTEDKALCLRYETEAIKQLLYKQLAECVRKLIGFIEELFKEFPRTIDMLDEKIRENVESNRDSFAKVLYVHASGEEKEAMYQSLGIDLTGRNDRLNKEIIETVYGKFCAANRPSIKENQKYAEKPMGDLFNKMLLDASREMIVRKGYYKTIDLDILSAIRAESDFLYEKKQQQRKEQTIFGEEEEKEEKPADRDDRRKKAIEGYVTMLLTQSAPFLDAKHDYDLTTTLSGNELKINENSDVWLRGSDGKMHLLGIQSDLTFWGFNPDIAKEFAAYGTGSNSSVAANRGYGKNELYCYSSVYGVKAEAIGKFNETKNGVYYSNYDLSLTSMLQSKNETDTPHIDKTWHEFLPYVSAERQRKAEQQFNKTLWRAIAYGRLTLDIDNQFCSSVAAKDPYGFTVYRTENLLESGWVIQATDIPRLIKALKQDPIFEQKTSKELEDRFEEDVRRMNNYEDTALLRGLAIEGDLNPVTIITRYCLSKDPVPEIGEGLMGGLREVLKDLAERYDMARTDEKIMEAAFRLCYRVYKKSNMKKKKIVFKDWVELFKRQNLKVDDEDPAEGEGE